MKRFVNPNHPFLRIDSGKENTFGNSHSKRRDRRRKMKMLWKIVPEAGFKSVAYFWCIRDEEAYPLACVFADSRWNRLRRLVPR